jgi:hypothetical protein
MAGSTDTCSCSAPSLKLLLQLLLAGVQPLLVYGTTLGLLYAIGYLIRCGASGQLGSQLFSNA